MENLSNGFKKLHSEEQKECKFPIWWLSSTVQRNIFTSTSVDSLISLSILSYFFSDDFQMISTHINIYLTAGHFQTPDSWRACMIVLAWQKIKDNICGFQLLGPDGIWILIDLKSTVSRSLVIQLVG